MGAVSFVYFNTYTIFSFLGFFFSFFLSIPFIYILVYLINTFILTSYEKIISTGVELFLISRTDNMDVDRG